MVKSAAPPVAEITLHNPHPYKPLSYATVVLAPCTFPKIPETVVLESESVSPKAIIIGTLATLITRDVQEFSTGNAIIGLAPTTIAEDVDTDAGSPDVAEPSGLSSVLKKNAIHAIAITTTPTIFNVLLITYKFTFNSHKKPP